LVTISNAVIFKAKALI